VYVLAISSIRWPFPDDENVPLQTLDSDEDVEFEADWDQGSQHLTEDSDSKPLVVSNAPSKPVSCWLRCCSDRLRGLLEDSTVRVVLAVYSIASFAVIGNDEVYPVWASSPPEAGGLGWTSSQSECLVIWTFFLRRIFSQ
jgi:hypothetical protein